VVLLSRYSPAATASAHPLAGRRDISHILADGGHGRCPDPTPNDVTYVNLPPPVALAYLIAALDE
jgi:hypothetical protein